MHTIGVSARGPQKRSSRNDCAVHSDGKFFERHPHRQHRIRLASQDERQRAVAEYGPLPIGHEIYTVVRNVADGARIRIYGIAPAGTEVDPGETAAQAAFEQMAPSLTAECEAIMRQCLTDKPCLAPAATPSPIAWTKSPPQPAASVERVPPVAEAWSLPEAAAVPDNDKYVGASWTRDPAVLSSRQFNSNGSDGAAADREFFKHHPSRQYRVRLASQFERQLFSGPVPHGREMYAVVNKGRDRTLARMFLAAPTARWEEVGEAKARAAFTAAAPAGWRSDTEQYRDSAFNGDDDAGQA